MAESWAGFYKHKTVLVTGHTGFKGSWISMWLKRLGAKVIGYALDPPTMPSLYNLCKVNDMVTNIKGDVRDYEHLHWAIKNYQPEIVFHLAAQALVRRSYQEPLATYATNIMGTANLLEAMRKSPVVKAAVVVSSDKCYENQEWLWGYRENDPIGGSDPYSSSKGCTELIAGAYLKSYFPAAQYGKHGMAIATARAGNVIGGGDWAKDRIIPDCVRAFIEQKPVSIRSPHAIRPWQHVLEPLGGYLLLAQKLYQSGSDYTGAWNFGPRDDDIKTVKWLVQYISGLWGEANSWITDEGSHPYEANYLMLDCSRAQKQLGWRAQWNLELALGKTVQWYKAYYSHADMLKISLEQIAAYERQLNGNLPGKI